MNTEVAMRNLISTLTLVLATSTVSGAAHAADPEAGARVFRSQCATCHAVAPGRNLVGPTLAGLVGRRAGTVPGFRYSPANKQANITWDADTLDKYLTDPRGTIPGTSMMYVGVKADTQRDDLIAYLSTLK